MASTVSRYGLSVEIPGEIEEQGAAAVEAHVATALDAACQATYRVPLAQLDAEVADAIADVPEGEGPERELAVRQAVADAVAAAVQRAQTLPPVAAPSPAFAPDDEETL